MSNINSTKNELCLAVGAGAIGKSITGYVFRQIGCQVVFADINTDVINDLNNRGGYLIRSTQTGLPSETIKVSGVSAFHINSSETAKVAIKADYLCTSVGANGLRSLMPVIAEWVKQRNMVNSQKLRLMLFENDADCMKIIVDGIQDSLGFVPEWLVISKASIERMTKPDKNERNEYNVIAEQFIPVILPKHQFIGSKIEACKKYFELVDHVESYYFRKLYTNNLGHAILGYMGTYYGFENTIDAMNNPVINKHLIKALHESGQMLIRKYGFCEDEINRHLDSLFIRYRNEDFKDSLLRLSRDPLRKLGRNERISGAICSCIENGISPEAIIGSLFYALRYNDRTDPSACALSEIMAKDGITGVLSKVCGIDESDTVYTTINNLYAEYRFLDKH